MVQKQDNTNFNELLLKRMQEPLSLLFMLKMSLGGSKKRKLSCRGLRMKEQTHWDACWLSVPGARTFG